MPGDVAILPFGLTPDQAFRGASAVVALLWLLLLFAPRWRPTRILVHSILPILLLAPLYGLLIARGPALPEGAFSLATLVTDLGTPVYALAAWVHYLLLNLFAGAWEARDAERRGVSHLAVIPCLLMTMLLGPLGLLLYVLLRTALRRAGGALD